MNPTTSARKERMKQRASMHTKITILYHIQHHSVFMKLPWFPNNTNTFFFAPTRIYDKSIMKNIWSFCISCNRFMYHNDLVFQVMKPKINLEFYGLRFWRSASVVGDNAGFLPPFFTTVRQGFYRHSSSSFDLKIRQRRVSVAILHSR